VVSRRADNIVLLPASFMSLISWSKLAATSSTVIFMASNCAPATNSRCSLKVRFRSCTIGNGAGPPTGGEAWKIAAKREWALRIIKDVLGLFNGEILVVQELA